MVTITRAKSGRTEFKGESIGEFKARQRAKLKARRAGREDIARKLSKTRDPKTVKALSQITGLKVSTPEIVEVVGRKKTARGEEIMGFTRADLVKREALRAKARALQAKKIVSFLPSGQIVRAASRGEIKKEKPFEPTTADVIEIIERTKKGEFRGQRVQVGKFASGDVKVVKETKPQTILRKIGNIDRSISKKLGLQKTATKFEELQELRFKGKVPGTEKVATNIVTDILRRPVSNAALVGVGAGVAKTIGTLGLKYTKLVGRIAQKGGVLTSKELALYSKVVPLGAGAVIGTTYAASVIKEGLEEKAKTGSIDKTTANAIRELMLFSIGSKLGTSVKTQKLTQLQKEFNKLPVSQQKALQNRLNKISKASPKEFKVKDLGLIKQLDRLQIQKRVKAGRITEDIVIVTKNNLFFVKKGNIPKKTKSFFVDVVGVKSLGTRGIKVNSGLKARVKVRFDTKTGKVIFLDKPVSFDSISLREANSLIKRITPGIVKKTRKVSVRGFEKTIKKPKRIINIKSNDLKDLKKIEFLSNKAFNKKFGEGLSGVYLENKNKIFIKDIGKLSFLDKRELNILLKGKGKGLKKFSTLKQRAKAIKNVVSHERGHNIDLKIINKPIFDGVKNIKTGKKFLLFSDKLHKQGILTKGKDGNYWVTNYPREEIGAEIRAELYKTFFKNPKLLKKKQPIIYNNILKNLKSKGLKPTINEVFKKVDVKLKIKPSQKKITNVLEAELKTKVKKLSKLERVKNLVLKKEQLEFLQFTPTKAPKKPVKAKIPKIDKKPIKADQLFIIGEKGTLVLKKKKTPLTIKKKPVKKPITNVKIIGTGKDIKAIPLVTPKTRIRRPRIKKVKPRIKPVIKPKIITKPKIEEVIKPSKIIKPKIEIKPISKKKPKTKPRIIPKEKRILKPTQLIKPKVSVKKALVQKTRIRRPVLKKLKLKFPKVKIPIFKFKPKTKTLTGKKKVGKKPEIKLFTPTLIRPKKKKELFIPTTEIVSGLEKR